MHVFILAKDSSKSAKSPQILKKIYVYNYIERWNWVLGRDAFTKQNCPVDTCTLMPRINESEADAVIFTNKFPSKDNPWPRPAHQVIFNNLI
jgi:hypothetical protein